MHPVEGFENQPLGTCCTAPGVVVTAATVVVAGVVVTALNDGVVVGVADGPAVGPMDGAIDGATLGTDVGVAAGGTVTTGTSVVVVAAIPKVPVVD